VGLKQKLPRRGVLFPKYRRVGTVETLDSYLLSLSPILYQLFNETSGAVVNYGSLGSTGNGTVTGTGITQGASGVTTTGSTETGRVEIPNNAAFNALQAVTWVFRGTFTGAGNGSVARVFQLGSANYRVSQLTTNRLQFVVARASGNETLTSSNNLTNYTPTPLIVFAAADATNGIALHRGLSGVVTAFGTANVQTGAISTQTGTLAVANENVAPNTRQHPGTSTLFVCIPSVLTQAQMERITTLAGV
jgi:hypothetical protein